MNEIWVLSVKTSLPNVCYDDSDIKTTTDLFYDFEKAKAAFRAKIKEFAFSENAMFDGNGHIKYLSKYLDNLEDYSDEGDNEGLLTPKILSEIQDALTEAFAGNEVQLNVPDDTYTDWMIAVKVKSGTIRFFGDDDGPYNGYDPVLKTNIFSMAKTKSYYLHIDDMLGQEVSSELCIDLKKAKIQ